MAQEVRDRVEALNQALGGVSPYRVGVDAPTAFHAATVNARFMKKSQYAQLVANVKRDGNLGSLPLCWKAPDGQLHILSGHHRIQAAVDAGVSEVLYLYLEGDLKPAQRTAIQISHNSIVGEDDLTVLKQQWESIQDLEAKLYSGLDDNFFKGYDPVNLGLFNEKGLTYQTVELQFLPSELETLKTILDKIGKSKRARFGAPLQQFDAFTQALMRFKDAAGIINSAIAFHALVHIADLFCDHVEKMGEDPSGETLLGLAVDAGVVSPPQKS